MASMGVHYSSGARWRLRTFWVNCVCVYETENGCNDLYGDDIIITFGLDNVVLDIGVGVMALWHLFCLLSEAM